MDCSLPGFSVHGDSPGKNTGVGCHALLQGLFPTYWSNPGLQHCGWILYHLSHKGSPRILERVAIPFSGDLPNPGIKPGCPELQMDSLPAELRGKPHLNYLFNLFLSVLQEANHFFNVHLLKCICICMHILLFNILFHMAYHRILDIVPCPIL